MAPLNGFELYKKIKNVDDSLKVCFITAFEDYRQEFKGSFPKLDEIKCFISTDASVRKLKAIEDLVNQVATILG
jgi:two-component SAPR family response regulator